MSHPFEPADPGKAAAPEPEFPPEMVACMSSLLAAYEDLDALPDLAVRSLRALRAGGFLRTERNPLIDCDPGDGVPRGCGGKCNVCLRLLVETVEGERDAAAAAEREACAEVIESMPWFAPTVTVKYVNQAGAASAIRARGGE